jgi:hypothetical protein
LRAPVVVALSLLAAGSAGPGAAAPQASGTATSAGAWSAQALWDAWPQARVVPTAAPCLRHAELGERLRALQERHGDRFRLETIGRSFEGRSIQQFTVGRGPRTVLLWSQMHGDEPSATPALLDVADYLLAHAQEPAAAAILEKLTLIAIPMLNPDGTERYQRRNAQAIDINRDALNLATPEGQLLKSVRDRHQPELGFNLHDQNRRTTVTGASVLASIALLAVSGDAQGTVTPGRVRAKRACTAVSAAMSPFVPGGVTRYDEDWSPRAFGDNITAWGTPVVLIESGGLPAGRPATDLTRLNFVALLTTLADLAVDDLAGHDPAAYDAMPRNETGAWADVVLRGGQVSQSGLDGGYRADVAFDATRSDLEWAGCGPPRSGSRIVEVGDARFLASGQAIDATGALVVPALTVSVLGLEARTWLNAEALDALARLGVGTVRWHVSLGDRGAAERHAQSLAGVGRTAVQVVDDEAKRAVVIAKAPSAPSDPSLGAALRALVGAKDGTADADLVAALAGPSPLDSRAIPLTLDAPAHLMVLRETGPAGANRPDAFRIESVWIDGRLARRP